MKDNQSSSEKKYRLQPHCDLCGTPVFLEPSSRRFFREAGVEGLLVPVSMKEIKKGVYRIE